MNYTSAAAFVVAAMMAALAAAGPAAAQDSRDPDWFQRQQQEEDRKNPNCVRDLVRGNDMLGDLGYGKIKITNRDALITSAARACKMDPALVAIIVDDERAKRKH